MAVFVMATLGAGQILAAVADTPPQELVQYIREAKRQGLNDVAVRQNAVAVGWPAAIVDEAILFAGKDKADAPGLAANSAPESVKAGTESAAKAVAPTPMPVAEAPVMSATGGVPARPQANRGVPDDYQIGAGDVLQISVWKEPEASVPSAVVRPDGKISIPLLKEVDVLGVTPRQAEAVITEGLSKLINSPEVTVIVTTINSKKIYVVGAAKKEGPLAYTYRMTVMQAISEAGGLTDYAKRKRIYILHTDNGMEYRLPFNYDEVVKGEKMEQNILLSPGDTLLIPH